MMETKKRSVNGFSILDKDGIVIAKVLVTGKLAVKVKDALENYAFLLDYDSLSNHS